ncbi:MAG: hypothetical protein JSW28_05415 [Thermoplasmata archaeon]|nr:MAG: hypothetical protein JSW28_05415 [Thermoplasmata archaeon]
MAQDSDVHVFVTGPDTLPINTTVEYTIRITGGPAEESGGNWSFVARMQAEEAIPIGAELDPQNATSEENIFVLNVTTPQHPQQITLIVNGSSSTNDTNIQWSGEVFKDVTVFEPYIVNITATVRNPGVADVSGAVVSFYVDGNLIGNRTVDVLANSTESIYVEWVASTKDEGEHIVVVKLNDNGALLEFDSGDNIIRRTIYVGERPERELHPIMYFRNAGLLFTLITVSVLFAAIAFLMRRNTIRGRGYYTPGQSSVMYFEGFLMVALSLPVLYVSQVLYSNPDVEGDANTILAVGIALFILGFLAVLFTWDRTRRKRR